MNQMKAITQVLGWQRFSQKLFPKSFNDDVHRFLAISEAIAHLDYAESAGKIAVEMKQGVEVYRKM
jgi:hypothetical protein